MLMGTATMIPAVSSAQGLPSDLHRDQRGAVMVIGLCMSCFLIGSLWFIIGIGDAIVFRDGMQEATDHATFTSAVLHAKGMNFISACNLFILALVMVHIIMGLIHDILLAICIISLGTTCAAFTAWRKVYTTYGKIFKPIAGALHYAELAASYGVPLVAAYKGYTVGSDYGGFGPKQHDIKMIVISPSLMPGTLIDAQVMNKLFTRKGKGKVDKDGKPTDDKNYTTDTRASKKGLPVQAKKFSDVCDLVAKKGIGGLFALTGISNSAAISMVSGWIGGILKFRYCNESGGSPGDMVANLQKGQDAIDKGNAAAAAKPVPKGGKAPDPVPAIDMAPGGGAAGGGGAAAGGGGGFMSGSIAKIKECMMDNSTIDPGVDKWWGCDGPLVPWSGTENGSPWNAVWGINWSPPYTDAQEHNVGLAGRKYGLTSTAESSSFFAQAEFYFDCKKDWTDEACNKDDNAGYSVQWRARLRRLEFPQFATLLSSYAGGFLSNMQGYKDIAKKVTQIFQKKGPDGKLLPADQQGVLGGKGMEGMIDALIKKYITKNIQAGGRNLGKLLDPDLGAYH
jgi:hypothetical protein